MKPVTWYLVTDDDKWLYSRYDRDWLLLKQVPTQQLRTQCGYRRKDAAELAAIKLRQRSGGVTDSRALSRSELFTLLGIADPDPDPCDNATGAPPAPARNAPGRLTAMQLSPLQGVTPVVF